MSVDKNVKAAMARSFKREAKEQEKQDKRRENERKEEQKRAELKPAKEKWTKTITTTQSRKRAREKAGYADEDLAGSSEVVWKQKGSEAGSAACAHVALRQESALGPPPTPPIAPADATLAHSRAPRSAGKNIPAMAAAFDVLAFLKQRADYEEASLGDIREGALTQP